MQVDLNQMGNMGQAIMIQMNEQAQHLIQAISTSCLDILGQQEGIYIKQKFELLEAMAGFETPNVYKVYAANNQGKKKDQKALFKCKEKSSACARNCLPGNSRPFEMKNFQPSMAKTFLKDDKRVVFKLKREYQCTCLCFNRPRLEVQYVENDEKKNQEQLLIHGIFAILAVKILILMTTQNILQKQVVVKFTFGVDVHTNNAILLNFQLNYHQKRLQLIYRKKEKIVAKNMVSDADNFSLMFLQGASKEDKALLLAVTLMMDYMYFEDKGGVQELSEPE